MEHLSKKDIEAPLLTKDEIEEILYLSRQGGGRHRLITNLYKIDTTTLYKILQSYSTQTTILK